MGACRHLVKDRMDFTVSRLSLSGAEAVLRFRSMHVIGDWGKCLKLHERKDYERNHRNHYARPETLAGARLRLVK